ncbi:VOC family protein [Alteribacter populi]|uniref:VOC family protein n=1 Tax=Alteribacter populi TaxID=2011011 RepID=UPI000BBAB0D2|nr:VOC family protein [Alteribacter populi]
MANLLAGIDHIQLAAPKDCEEEARHFYNGLLGLEEIPKPENLRKRGGVWFKLGSQELHIGVQEAFIPAKKAHPGFIVHDLQEVKNLLTNENVEIKEEPPIKGRERFFVSDPFENRIEFLAFD